MGMYFNEKDFKPHPMWAYLMQTDPAFREAWLNHTTKVEEEPDKDEEKKTNKAQEYFTNHNLLGLY